MSSYAKRKVANFKLRVIHKPYLQQLWTLSWGHNSLIDGSLDTHASNLHQSNSQNIEVHRNCRGRSGDVVWQIVVPASPNQLTGCTRRRPVIVCWPLNKTCGHRLPPRWWHPPDWSDAPYGNCVCGVPFVDIFWPTTNLNRTVNTERSDWRKKKRFFQNAPLTEDRPSGHHGRKPDSKRTRDPRYGIVWRGNFNG